MEIYRAAFLIALMFMFNHCHRELTKNDGLLDAEMKQVNLWLDAMPKVNEPSLLHFEIDLTLKNKSNKQIEIDSISFELMFDENLSFIFPKKKEPQIKIKPSMSVEFNNKFAAGEIKEIKKLSDKTAKIFINLSYKENGNYFNQKILLGEKKIEMVY
ncbi:MAG: hypothetical protein N3F03_07085 [Ignavibacteria bacterium]|nr:hypothetical protein [Ignavibacteria bacterium]